MSDLPIRNPIEYRSAGTLEVRYPERIIELLAVPYDTPTVVIHNGRSVEETIAPGAFDGIERRANRIKVNLGHDENRTVGRAVALHADRAEGLVAELRIGRGADRDQVLDDAADGILDASIGFAPVPGHELWTENRSQRTITKAFLAHIALVPNPAYETAQVLSVRQAMSVDGDSTGTPYLDRIRLARLADEYGLSL